MKMENVSAIWENVSSWFRAQTSPPSMDGERRPPVDAVNVAIPAAVPADRRYNVRVEECDGSGSGSDAESAREVVDPSTRVSAGGSGYAAGGHDRSVLGD